MYAKSFPMIDGCKGSLSQYPAKHYFAKLLTLLLCHIIKRTSWRYKGSRTDSFISKCDAVSELNCIYRKNQLTMHLFYIHAPPLSAQKQRLFVHVMWLYNAYKGDLFFNTIPCQLDLPAKCSQAHGDPLTVLSSKKKTSIRYIKAIDFILFVILQKLYVHTYK